jgi:hypothetical protein
MALANLMKKGFLTSAIATSATPATNERSVRHTAADDESEPLLFQSSEATVAGVAVAKFSNFKNAAFQVPAEGLCELSIKPILSIAEQLALFRFDLVQKDIDSGHPSDEIHRTNNMAWEFMQADGMRFSDAMKIAIEIVISLQVADCEAAYIDPMELINRVTK